VNNVPCGGRVVRRVAVRHLRGRNNIGFSFYDGRHLFCSRRAAAVLTRPSCNSNDVGLDEDGHLVGDRRLRTRASPLAAALSIHNVSVTFMPGCSALYVSGASSV